MLHGGRRARVIDLVMWSVVAFVGAITVTQAIGWTATAPVAVVQSLTPYLAVALVPVVAVAFVRRRLLLVTVASAVGFGLGVLATPLAFPDTQAPAAADSTGLRVASLNLLYRNQEIADVADELSAVDVDVLVFSEFTIEHRAALRASSLSRSFPYRAERTGRGATGMAIWSRYPIEERVDIDSFNDSIDADVRGPDGDLRVVAMHMPTPIVDVGAWRADLRNAAAIGRSADGPTLLIGDLNSSYWHPDFRRLLDSGFVDAHIAAGAGFSASWPTDWWVPPFVRLDHALTTGGLVSTDVEDLDIPGSDHRGLVVTVAPAR